MVSAKVAFDYSPEQADELTLKVGELVTNIDKQDGGWWEGDLNGKRGMFPENFVELVPEKAPAPSGKKHARVTFQYSPEQQDELFLEVGDVVEVLEDDDDGWWRGRLNGKEGVFPSNFVELMNEEVAQSPTLPEPLKSVPTSAPPQSVPPVSAPPEDQPEVPSDVGEIKSSRPKSQMGFGITLGDLSRNKLKKTAKGDLPAVPTVEVKLEKKPTPPPPTAIPPSQQTMVTKTVQKARVTFAYEPEQDDELKLSVGDVLVITNKDIFEGWMQGEFNGKKGLFPDNFVELLPLEKVTVESSLELPGKETQQRKSVKRAAKEDPSVAHERHVDKQPSQPSSPEKQLATPLFPPGGNPLKAELEKKLAASRPAPPPPTSKSKPSKPGPPAKPTKPKAAVPPPHAKKPALPPSSGKSSPIPLTKNIENSFSVSDRPGGAGLPHRSPSQSASLPRSAIPSKQDEKSGELDLDAVKSSDPLKHIQRAKPPAKHPPSKFKSSDDVTDGDPIVPMATDITQVTELKTQVSDLTTKMNEMEKKFRKLFKQLQDELDSERKNRMNQQVEIDRLKRQLEVLEDH